MTEQNQLLPELIRSYLGDDEIALRPGDATEARTNTWAYGFKPSDVDQNDVAAALHDVGNSLRERLAGNIGPGTFYAWYDQQAGQLRCSLASAAPTELPFGNGYTLTDDPHLVAQFLAMDPTPGFVPWGQLSDSAEPGGDAVGGHLNGPTVWACPVLE